MKKVFCDICGKVMPKSRNYTDYRTVMFRKGGIIQHLPAALTAGQIFSEPDLIGEVSVRIKTFGDRDLCDSCEAGIIHDVIMDWQEMKP